MGRGSDAKIIAVATDILASIPSTVPSVPLSDNPITAAAAAWEALPHSLRSADISNER